MVASRLTAILVAGLTALAVAPAAHAQQAELVTAPARRFDRVDALFSFPQSSVYSLAEPGDGYLWATTLDGLVRFDGVRQRVYDTQTPGLATSRLTALYVDRARGDLWIGTEDGRLIRMRSGQFATVASRTQLGGVTGLQVDYDRQQIFVFHQTGAQALTIVDDATPTVAFAGPPVRGVSNYGAGTWLLGDRELWHVNHHGFAALPLPTPLHRLPHELRSGGGPKTLWLRAHGSAVWRVEGSQISVDERSSSIPKDAIPFAEDAYGNLWLHFYSNPRFGRLGRLGPDGHVTRYDAQSGIDPFAVPVAIHTDREGGLWVGTTVGLYRYLGEAISGRQLRIDDHDTPVAALFAASNGLLWVTGRDWSLTALTPENTVIPFTTMDPTGGMMLRPEAIVDRDGLPSTQVPPRTQVLVFREDQHGQVWLGANSGLFVDRGDHKLTLFPERDLPGGVNDILVADDGLWLATWSAVVRFVDDHSIHIYGPDQGITSGAMTLLQDHAGTLWAGTNTGVLRLAGDQFVAVPNLGPQIGAARALHEDALHQLWVGTYNRGLFRRLPDGSIQHAGASHGLPSSGVFTLHFDPRGWLWLTSNRGLVRTRIADIERVFTGTDDRLASVVYGAADGLPSTECNGGFGNAGYVCAGGAWCVDTLGGVGIARLDELRIVDVPPVPVIEEVHVDGSLRPVANHSITLQPSDRTLVVRYTGIAFEAAGDVVFHYRLSGHDERWVDAQTRREAVFGDLPPGTYHLEIHSENREGIRSSIPARLHIVVLPAWWERTSVQFAAVLGLLGLLGAGIRHRLRQLERRHHAKEATLLAAAEDLERRVQERTAVLNTEILERRRAEQAAQQASAVKSSFLAQMSHELRTPLNAIIGLSTMLAKTTLTDQQRGWIKTVCSSGEALLTIIDDVLDFSRIEAGRIEFACQAFSPATVVEESVAIVTHQAEAKGLKIAWGAAPSLPDQVLGDPSRLRQVLLNLLGNAIKFTTTGTVMVTANATPEAEGWRLKISVQDTGIGIDTTNHQRIFEPFVQADASTSRRFGGSGLGLSIAQGIITGLGGSLTVDSTVGIGSTFTLELPVSMPTTTSNPLITPSETDPITPDLASLRVLVIDDEPINLTVAEAMLERFGCTYMLTPSGEQALALLDSHDFDVILIDIHMPGLSGLETCRRLRAELAPHRQPWVTATTAAVTGEDREKCVAAGMNDFIAKPLRQHLLRRTLELALSTRANKPKPPRV